MLCRIIIILLVAFLPAMADAAESQPTSSHSPSVKRMLLPGTPAWGQYTPSPMAPQQQKYFPPSPPAQFSPSFPWRTHPSPSPPLPTPAKKSPSPPPAESAKNMKCSKNPMVCWDPRYGGDGSPRTSSCCYNKCVDLLSDNKNCGMCNNKCKFGTGCCKGICSNLAYDTNNCGRCGNSCGKGSRCVYGLCSYA